MNFQSLGGLPALKIGPQNEKLPTYLDDPHAFIFNDSAEMPNRKARHSSSVGNIEELSYRGVRLLSSHANATSDAQHCTRLAKAQGSMNGYR